MDSLRGKGRIALRSIGFVKMATADRDRQWRVKDMAKEVQE